MSVSIYIGKILGWILASIVFIVCVIITSPIVIARIEFDSFINNFNKFTKYYRGDKYDMRIFESEFSH